MSYSINHARNYFAESNLREVLKVIAKYKPDLVALQQVDSISVNDKVSFHLRQLSVQTGYHYLYGSSGKTEEGTYGVGLLSKWPFEKNQKLTMPFSAGLDARILLCGLVSPVEGFHFRICNARLEYGSLFDKAMQAAFVNQVLSPSIQPVLVAMDMGTGIDEQPYSSFKSGWLDAAGDSDVTTWFEGNPGDRFDYLLALKNTNIRVKSYQVISDYPNVSDHLPVLATFEFW